MQQKLRRLLGWSGLVVSVLGAIQACGDSSGNGGGPGGGSGEAATASGQAGMAASSSGAGGSAAGSSNGGTGTSGKASAGAAGNAGAGGNGADAGASASAGAGGSAGVTCHISWTGAATGEADCSHLDVCHHDFLSLGVHNPNAPAPLRSIQLIYSPTELSLGKFTAVDQEMENCNVQTTDAGVSYAPKYDAQSHLSDGTSMTGTLTDLQFSTDANDPCAGTAHGSFDVVMPQSTNSANTLTLHAEF